MAILLWLPLETGYKREYSTGMATDTQEPTTLEILAVNIRRRRKTLRLTQAELAAKVGCHQPYIALLEAGTDNVSVNQLCRLARALECTPAGLLRDYAS